MCISCTFINHVGGSGVYNLYFCIAHSVPGFANLHSFSWMLLVLLVLLLVIQVTDLLLLVKDLQSINQELKKKQLGCCSTDSQGKEALKILNHSEVGFLC